MLGRRLLLWCACVVFASCATARSVNSEHGAFSVQDYLKTAYDTLVLAETDTDGHRIRAQLETRAALAALEDSAPARSVPFTGPPTLAVALELLERSQQESTLNVMAQKHTLRAAAELKQALGIRP